MRLVSYVTAELEAEMGTDPMLAAVGWSWLTEALDAHGAPYTAASGTVTRVATESFGGMANVADSSGVVVGRRNKSEGFASGFVQPRSENALGNIVGEPIHEERSVGDGGAAEIVANGVTEFGAIADF